MLKDFISYEKITELIGKVTAQIRADNITYDYVIGFGRGGLIPATLLAYKLDIPVLCFSVASYTGTTQGDYTVHQEIDFAKLNKDTNIIVIDDICDTGDTFQFFQQIDKPNVNIIKYAALFTKEHSKNIIDYYGTIAIKDNWLVFPWEVNNE